MAKIIAVCTSERKGTEKEVVNGLWPKRMLSKLRPIAGILLIVALVVVGCSNNQKAEVSLEKGQRFPRYIKRRAVLPATRPSSRHAASLYALVSRRAVGIDTAYQ